MAIVAMKRKSQNRSISSGTGGFSLHENKSVMSTSGQIASKMKRQKIFVSKTETDKYDGEQGMYTRERRLAQGKCCPVQEQEQEQSGPLAFVFHSTNSDPTRSIGGNGFYKLEGHLMSSSIFHDTFVEALDTLGQSIPWSDDTIWNTAPYETSAEVIFKNESTGAANGGLADELSEVAGSNPKYSYGENGNSSNLLTMNYNGNDILFTSVYKSRSDFDPDGNWSKAYFSSQAGLSLIHI